jgi:hypothetical protein
MRAMMHAQRTMVSGGLASRLLRLALVVVLLNLPFWILSTHVFLSRAMISLDSLVALLLLQYSAPLGAMVIVISWVCDLAVSASLGYHFASPTEFFRSAGFVGNIHLPSFLNPAVLAGVSLFSLTLIAIRPLTQRRIGPLPVISVAILILLLDTTNGSSALSHRDAWKIPTNLAGSSFYALSRSAFDPQSDAMPVPVAAGSGGPAEFHRYLPMAGATDVGVLYVIVESFGMHRDAAVRRWLQQQLLPDSLAGTYAIAVGDAQTTGGTTAGELRRLCGLAGTYRKLDGRLGANCLPGQFRQAHWRTVGLHGFSQSMFDRERWWPLIGLQQQLFAEQLHQPADRMCGGAFRAVCDADLLARAVEEVQRPRRFVYALTLNTHLPVAPVTIPADLARVCAEAGTGDDVCKFLAHMGIAFRALAHELESHPRRPFVLLVGDHPPPFFERRSREQFAPDRVPLFAMKPIDPPSQKE